MIRRTMLFGAAALAVAAFSAGLSQATAPGTNGRIVFNRYGLHDSPLTLTGPGGQLDANGNFRAPVVGIASRTRAEAPAVKNGKIAFVDRTGTLDVVNPNRSALRRLARCPAAIDNCMIDGYAWSPNGKHLAFLRGHVGGAITASDLSLFVVDARGTRVRRLARCGGSCHIFWVPSYVSWSPDGTRIVFASDKGIETVNRVTGRTRQLTDSDSDYAPAWSPDGTRIAFERGKSLYTIRPDGSGLFEVATITSEWIGSLGQPTWAPDGQRIVFDGASTGIYVVGADGSNLHLLRSGSEGSGPATPSWSPDGRDILFFNTPSVPGGFTAEVWVMKPDGSQARRLYHSPCCVAVGWHPPIWSPDGKSIALSADTCSRDCSFAGRAGGIVLMDRNGHHRRRLSRSESEIAWQPIPHAHGRSSRVVVDGVATRLSQATAPGSNGRIAFNRYALRDRPLTAHIVVANSDGSRQRTITHASRKYEDDQPDWSPDGSRIMFERCSKEPCHIWTIRPDGSDQRRLSPPCPPGKQAPPQCPDDAYPAYSPDGQHIAFVRYRSGKAGQVVMVADSHLRHPHAVGTGWMPGWSPDGKQLAFVSKPRAYPAIFVVNADGTGLRQVTPFHLQGNGHPDWSPDGTRILFGGGALDHGNLFTIHPDGTGLQQLTHYHGLTKMSTGSYSPDGKSIVFGMVVGAVNRPRATFNDLFVMKADGSHVRPITRNKRWDGSPDWGPRKGEPR